MVKKITIVKDRSLTPEKIMKLITDATEIKIQRPKNGQKKTHTIKSEMKMSEDGKIISVSKCYSGKVRDFIIKTEQRSLPRDCEKYGDLGISRLAEYCEQHHFSDQKEEKSATD